MNFGSYEEMQVFSAQAEVFLATITGLSVEESFLRASGGVSYDIIWITPNFEFSPRKRRCFLHGGIGAESGVVFSAQAEVFLL